MLGFALNSRKLRDKLMDSNQLVNEVSLTRLSCSFASSPPALKAPHQISATAAQRAAAPLTTPCFPKPLQN